MKAAKKSAEDFLPWGGWHATRENSPEVYARLPEWWRKWKDIIHDRVIARRRMLSVAEITQLVSPPADIPETYPPDLTLRTLVSWTGAEGRLADLMADLKAA